MNRRSLKTGVSTTMTQKGELIDLFPLFKKIPVNTESFQVMKQRCKRGSEHARPEGGRSKAIAGSQPKKLENQSKLLRAMAGERKPSQKGAFCADCP